MKTGQLIYRFMLTLSLFTGGSAHAQQQSILHGTVRDGESQETLSGVFVTIYIDNTSAGSTYTGEDGTFSIPYSRTPTSISATLLGYKVYHQDITTFSDALAINMIPATFEISAAAVRASVIEEHGDTLSYTAQAFADGNERILGELLDKLPGISVNASSGTIYHNGHPINKFYVEGMDLMGNRYGIVTKNLASDKIARVEVLQRHQPIRALQGINLTGESAINIILKENERGTWTFGATAAIGAPPLPLFSAQVMLSRFAKTSQNLFLIKGNNVGNDILREIQEQQYFGKVKSFVLDTQNADTDFATELRPKRTEIPLPQPYWYDNLSGIVSLNHLTKQSNTRQFRISLNGAAERFREQSVTREEIFLDEGKPLVIEEQRALSDLRYYTDLTAGWENNDETHYFSDEIKVTGQWRNAVSALSQNGPYSQQYELPSFKIDNQLRLTTRIHENQALTITSNTKFIRNNHRADYETSAYNATQELAENLFRSENTAGFDFKTGALRWSGIAGLNLSYSGTEVQLSGLAGQGIPDVHQQIGILAIHPHFSLRSTLFWGVSQWSISLPGALSLLSTQGRTMLVPDFSPSVSVSVRLNQVWDINASASYSKSYSAAESLLDTYIMQDWRTLAKRDALRQTDRFTAFVQLRFSDNPNMFYTSLSGNYSCQTNNRAASYEYNEMLSLRSYLPITTSDDTYSLNGRMTKYFGTKMFVVDLSCSAIWGNRNDYLQGNAAHYLDFSLTSELALRFNPATWFSAEARGSHIWTDIHGEVSTHSHTWNFEGNISVRPIRQLTLGVLGHGLWQQVPGTRITNTPLLDVSAGWRFQKFELVLECRNLLGCTEFSRESATAWQRITTVSHLCGRQYLLCFRSSL